MEEFCVLSPLYIDILEEHGPILFQYAPLYSVFWCLLTTVQSSLRLPVLLHVWTSW